MKKQTILCVMMALVIIFVPSCKNKSNKAISVAVNLPLTGYIGSYGQRMQTGMDMAREDLAEEMKEQGIDFVFDYQDNRGETKDVITIYNKQMMSKPDVYMSGITTQTMAIIDQVRKADVIHFLWSWTPLYLEEGNKEFRSWLNFGSEARLYIDYILKNQPKRVAYLHIDNIGSKVQCQEVVLPAVKKELPDIEFYTEQYPATTTDFKNIITKVKQFNPDLIIASGYKESLISMVQYLDAYKFDRSKIYCSMDLLEAIDEVSNEDIEGLHVSAPEFNIASIQSPETKAWIDVFKQRFGRIPVYTEAYGYDLVHSLYLAAKLSQEEGINLYEALHKVNFAGVTGQVYYTATGDIVDNLHIGVFHNGQLIIE